MGGKMRNQCEKRKRKRKRKGRDRIGLFFFEKG